MLSEEERRELVRQRKLAPHERIVRADDHRFSPHVLLNMSRPECSPLLLGPLPEAAGGWGTCAHRFEGRDDPGYRQLLRLLREGKRQYHAIPRFGMADFKPNAQYVREMKRFGVLDASFDLARDPIDVFETDQRYWRLFWYQPQSEPPWPYLQERRSAGYSSSRR